MAWAKETLEVGHKKTPVTSVALSPSPLFGLPKMEGTYAMLQGNFDNGRTRKQSKFIGQLHLITQAEATECFSNEISCLSPDRNHGHDPCP